MLEGEGGVCEVGRGWDVVGKEAGSRGEASALRRDPECLHSSPEPHHLCYCNGACNPGLAEW